MRKIATAIASVALVTGLGLGAALTGAGAAPAPRTTICHGTGSASNPYVKITVSENSFRRGHFHNGVEPGHGPGHADNPDYLIGADDTCATVPPDTTVPGSTTEPEPTTTVPASTTEPEPTTTTQIG
jgi:hypothetical protein